MCDLCASLKSQLGDERMLANSNSGLRDSVGNCDTCSRFGFAAINDVPSILDCIIRATRKELGYFGPLVAHLALQVIDQVIFLLGETALVDLWAEMIVVSLSALLA